MAFKCDYCVFRSKKEILLESHIYNKHKRPMIEEDESLLKMYKCHLCYSVYNHVRSLIRHLSSECGQQPKFQCPYCPFKAKHKHHAVEHIRNVHKIIE